MDPDALRLARAVNHLELREKRLEGQLSMSVKGDRPLQMSVHATFAVRKPHRW